MRVLFIGGTGIISSACSALAVERGIDLFLLNRGQTTHREIPPAAKIITGNIRDINSARNALKNYEFDVVVDWIAFTPEHIQADLELFRGKTGQYIFISSASAYQTPPQQLPVTEETPLENPFWEYSRQKIACENLLMQEYQKGNLPVTIVRPSHTYDKTLLPFTGRYTVIDRMRQGKEVIVYGDGTSVWVLTHHRDFAKGLVGLLGQTAALGEAFHITSYEWLTWNQIFQTMADAAGVVAKLVHVPSDLIHAYDANWGDGLLGDKSHSMIFDNSKIKRFVPDFNCEIPFSEGSREIMAWYDGAPERQKVDHHFNNITDRIIAAYCNSWPQ